MMTGTWAHKGGAVLTLRRDGTFTGLNLPNNFGEASGPQPSYGSGTWHIGRLGDLPKGLVLTFTGLTPPLTEQLLVENCCGMPVTIFYDLGDPDEGVTGQYQLTRQRT
jgi:hypothetical protein